MIVEGAVTAGMAVTAAVLFGARALLHRGILHGLRAPRVRHGLPGDGLGVAPGLVREVRLTGPRQRRLAAWLVMPAPTSNPAGAADVAAVASAAVPAVLVMHGWGGNAAMMWPLVPPLHAAGLAVLLVDARCHGHSDDETFTSMPRFAEDIAAGLAWLRQQPGIDPDRLALLGHSVGAAACLLHAARHPDVRAVVSLSAFAHPREVMRRFMAQHRVPHAPLGWYVLRHVQRVIGTPFDAIAPLHTMGAVRCPVLLVHGRDDRTVPFDDALRLQRASPGAQLLAVDGDHDLRLALDAHAGSLVAFFRAHLVGGSAADPASSSRGEA